MLSRDQNIINIPNTCHYAQRGLDTGYLVITCQHECERNFTLMLASKYDLSMHAVLYNLEVGFLHQGSFF